MIYVYSSANNAARTMGNEPLAEPWPMFLVAVFDDEQEEEAAELLHWLRRPSGAYSVAALDGA